MAIDPVRPRFLVNVITESSAGLAVDAEVVSSYLPNPEFRVKRVFRDRSRAGRGWNFLRARWRKARERRRVVVNLHCQEIAPRLLGCADYNVLIPNQEWATPRTIQLLGRMDAIFCKTRYAEHLYRTLSNSVFVGFTSLDRRDDSVTKDFGSVLHLAGKSGQKGTRTLARVWSRHPEWPILYLVLRREGVLDGIEAPNIRHIAQLSEPGVRALQNRCGIHLCPSEAEGYGHSIGEGMSTGALLLSTDAPPMNELVDASRGFLVPFDSEEPLGLGKRFFVDESALERAIDRGLGLPREAQERFSVAARRWFELNRQAFVLRLPKAIREMAASTPVGCLPLAEGPRGLLPTDVISAQRSVAPVSLAREGAGEGAEDDPEASNLPPREPLTGTHGAGEVQE